MSTAVDHFIDSLRRGIAEAGIPTVQVERNAAINSRAALSQSSRPISDWVQRIKILTNLVESQTGGRCEVTILMPSPDKPEEWTLDYATNTTRLNFLLGLRGLRWLGKAGGLSPSNGQLCNPSNWAHS